MMMSIASAYTLFAISSLKGTMRFVLKFVFLIGFFFVLLYPFFAFPSYYTKLTVPEEKSKNLIDKFNYYNDLLRNTDLDGSGWITVQYPEDKEIIDYLNNKISGQPVILEAQGDSYTDYERVSAYTGLPTVAGWWVHEWLWRGSADVVGKRIPDIVAMYENEDTAYTLELLKKYKVKYVIIGSQEKVKYPQLKQDKFETIGKKIFQSTNSRGAIYELNY